eukprot:Pgem_evm1s9471
MCWCDDVQLKKLESLQLCVLKWILGCSDKTSSSYIRNELGIVKLEYQLIKLRLKWFGNVIVPKNVNIIGKVIDLDSRYVSRDINMDKWNCEVRKRINRKEFRDFTTD